MLSDIMNDFYNLVDKYDYFVLQGFCGFRELFDAHDTENHVYLGSTDHNIHEFIGIC